MRVAFVPTQPHSLVYGGFEGLMNSTYDILKNKGIDVIKLDFWDKNVEYDIVHFWGIGIASFENIAWASKAGKKVIVTALFADYVTIKQKARFYISKYIHSTKFLLMGLKYVDHLVLTNLRHQKVSEIYYKYPISNTSVIPNTLLAKYYNYKGPFCEVTTLKDYVLSVGSICSRKNQIRLIEAVNKIGFKLLVMGDVLAGEEEYGSRFAKLVAESNNVEWIKGFPRDSVEMISAYKNASIFAMPSLIDQQPTSAQEAGLLGRPLLMSDLPFSKQSYYQNAYLANPYSVAEIAKGLIAISKNPEKFVPPKTVFDVCREENVAEAYISIYNKVIAASLN